MIRSAFAVVAMAVLAVLGPVSPAVALHRKTDVVVQITGDGGGTISNPRWTGLRYVVFDTDADLLANGNTTRQVFLYDLEEHDLAGTRAIYQLTTGGDDNRRADAGMHARTVLYDARPGGVGARQLVAFDREGGTTHVLTQGSADTLNVAVDDSERYAVFESSADLLGGGAAAGSQIYALDLRHADFSCPFPCPASGNAGLVRITNKAGTSRNAVTSRRGKMLALQSDADLLGSGAVGDQVYVYDAVDGLARVSDGTHAARNPTISNQHQVVAFEADDGAGGTQIMLYKHALGTTQALTSAANKQSTNPSLVANGRALIFVSNADLLQNGSTGAQVFHYDVRAAVLSQITHADAVADAAYSAGSFLTFLSTSDLRGNGSTSLDLYLVNLFKLGAASVP